MSKTIFVMVGQSGMGKTTAINAFAKKELGKTGLYDSQTCAMKEFIVPKNGQEHIFLDTIGLHDNQNLSEFTDD